MIVKGVRFRRSTRTSCQGRVPGISLCPSAFRAKRPEPPCTLRLSKRSSRGRPASFGTRKGMPGTALRPSAFGRKCPGSPHILRSLEKVLGAAPHLSTLKRNCSWSFLRPPEPGKKRSGKAGDCFQRLQGPPLSARLRSSRLSGIRRFRKPECPFLRLCPLSPAILKPALLRQTAESPCLCLTQAGAFFDGGIDGWQITSCRRWAYWQQPCCSPWICPQPPETRWSEPWRQRKRRSAERNG